MGELNEASESRYVVLALNTDTDEWIEYGDPVAASTAEKAVRKVSESFGTRDQVGTFVAVPARSWKPMRVRQVQTVQTTVEAIG